jgi:hypothetical protein
MDPWWIPDGSLMDPGGLWGKRPSAWWVAPAVEMVHSLQKGWVWLGPAHRVPDIPRLIATYCTMSIYVNLAPNSNIKTLVRLDDFGSQDGTLLSTYETAVPQQVKEDLPGLSPSEHELKRWPKVSTWGKYSQIWSDLILDLHLPVPRFSLTRLFFVDVLVWIFGHSLKVHDSDVPLLVFGIFGSSHWLRQSLLDFSVSLPISVCLSNWWEWCKHMQTSSTTVYNWY